MLFRSIDSYDGVADLLGGLKAAGCAIGIVTSKARPTVQLAFDALPEVQRHVDLLVAVEDTDVHKPRPDPLILALRRLGADPWDACYVGDAPFDVAAGNAAGVTTVGVTWGFFPREAVEDADVVFDDVPALARYLMEDPA